jgi:hypothetical protein
LAASPATSGGEPVERCDGATGRRGDGATVRRWLCPKTPPAMPADVRKAFGLPARLSSRFWATPNLLGRSPKFIVSRNGSAERFRTSGGRAAGVNHFLGKA